LSESVYQTTGMVSAFFLPIVYFRPMSHVIKGRLLCAASLIASLLIYLEWGGGNSAFLFSVEWELFRNLPSDPSVLAHPVVVPALLGQGMVLILLILPQPRPPWVLGAVFVLGLFPLLVLVIGLLSQQYRVVASVVPFFTVVWATWRWKSTAKEKPVKQ
jgi:hypothetical protein